VFPGSRFGNTAGHVQEGLNLLRVERWNSVLGVFPHVTGVRHVGTADAGTNDVVRDTQGLGIYLH
jgi:hypothetical protein